MNDPVPDGWEQIRGTKIADGDRIRTEFGWANADNIGKGEVYKSVVGHPTALF